MRTQDRALFYAAQHLSDRQAFTPEGFLICYDVPIARTGTMLYTQHDFPSLRPGNDGYIHVNRGDADLFRQETIASFEGKPVTDDHPYDDVTPDNWNQIAKGTVQNVRRGEGPLSDLLLGDLLITNKEAIAAVRDNKREVSAGYEADYDQQQAGSARQHNIIANHVALVAKGRCGPRCAIGDKETVPMTKPTLKDRVRAAFLTRDEKALDAALEEQGADGITINLNTADAKPAVAAVESQPTKDAEIEALKAQLKAKDAIIEEMTADEDEEDDDNKKTADEEELLEENGTGTNDAAPATPAATYADVVARAEIIAPGFSVPKLTRDAQSDAKKTADGLCACKRRALDAGLKHDRNKDAVRSILAGRSLDKMSKPEIDASFIAASELLKAQNNSRFNGDSRHPTRDEKTIDAHKAGGLDAIHQNFWKDKK